MSYHERADWTETSDPIERIYRYLFPERYDGGEVFEWDASTIETVAGIVFDEIDRRRREQKVSS